ncbi:S8 family serine peptidase [Streptomyces sp. NBC_01456]|uniref:S8 family serine peptidase n=1 Tax=unclassified Streptomyces TaxID=2593676 RepID=UPI002E317DB8|nr:MULTISPECIES: S8 family serine peptidase [unclassified Streptomyces]
MSFTRTLRAVGGAVVAGALLFGSAPAASADQIRNDQWPLKSFDAEKVWKVSTGKGVTVAVLDHPINGDHPDLKGNVLPGKDVENGGPANQESQENHGTSMAGIIAGHGHGAGNSDGVKGLAPDAKILPVALSVEVGDVPAPNTDPFADALNYAVDQGASVINMSFGWPVLTDKEKRALSYAAKKNVLLVVATGNDGLGHLDQLTSYPGVVAVGAVDKGGKVWEDSNYGPQTMLTAPGTMIRSAGANKPYLLANGTSDSAAYVSGAAALLRAKYPDLTAGQIANRLVKTAGLPPGQEGMKLPDPHYGYGFIRPLRALTQDIPAGSKNGPLKTPKTEPGAGAGGATALGSSGNGGDQTGEQKSSGLGIGAIVGIGAGVLVVVALIVIVVVRQKKNGRSGPPPGGPGGYGGPGFPQQPGPYQQPPAPYQQQPGAYQQPTAPGSFPPPPPNQPPGR